MSTKSYAAELHFLSSWPEILICQITTLELEQSYGTSMPPLHNIASGRTPQCKARSKRSLRRCKNPCAFGMSVCRFHGARRPESVKRGPAHPQYRHGRETLKARQRRVEGMTRIRRLVDLAVSAGFIRTRISGRRASQLQMQQFPQNNNSCEEPTRSPKADD